MKGVKNNLPAMKKILFVLSGILFLILVIMLTVYFTGNLKAENEIKQLAEYKNTALGKLPSSSENDSSKNEADGNTSILPEYQELYEKNNNLVGWISIPGTNIDYPVMQLNNDYYLYRDFEAKYSPIGLPFLDERCNLADSEQAKLIYGHNTKSGTLFHDLFLFDDEAYKKDHPTIYFDTLYERREYTVTRTEAFQDRDLQPELAQNQDILMLITCSYDVENGRFAVYAERKLEADSNEVKKD